MPLFAMMVQAGKFPPLFVGKTLISAVPLCPHAITSIFQQLVKIVDLHRIP